MTTHIPVLLDEVLNALRVEEGGSRYLDGTFGGGGHTRAILDGHPENTVIALDTDPEAKARAAELSFSYGERFTFYAANFEDLDSVVTGSFDGILFDFGLSSFHYDIAERGFSFRHDGPVDMRLNPEEGEPASVFLETAPREAMIRAIRQYGEEVRWRVVVDAIMGARGTGRLSRTTSLAELISEAVGPRFAARSKIHPATKSFQGIRISVNRELEVIESVLPKAFSLLNPGGRMAVISFHSLEDRLVKRYFRRLVGRPENRFDSCPLDLREIHATEMSRKPITPSEDEVGRNPRSRSSKMRVIEKVLPS